MSLVLVFTVLAVVPQLGAGQCCSRMAAMVVWMMCGGSVGDGSVGDDGGYDGRVSISGHGGNGGVGAGVRWLWMRRGVMGSR